MEETKIARKALLKPQCPFFRRLETRSVVCEGIVEDSSLAWRFLRISDMDIQYRVFCCQEYEKCELFKTLEKFHEDDDLKGI